MRKAIVNCRLFDGEREHTGRAVIIEGGQVLDLVTDDRAASRADESIDLDGLRLVPGFIDLQVNGGGGVQFNDAPTVDTIRTIGRAHRTYGTTGFRPTLISDGAGHSSCEALKPSGNFQSTVVGSPESPGLRQ